MWQIFISRTNSVQLVILSVNLKKKYCLLYEMGANAPKIMPLIHYYGNF